MLRYGAIDSAPNHPALDLRTRATVETKDFCLSRKLSGNSSKFKTKRIQKGHLKLTQWILNISKQASERFQFWTSKRSIEEGWLQSWRICAENLHENCAAAPAWDPEGWRFLRPAWPVLALACSGANIAKSQKPSHTHVVWSQCYVIQCIPMRSKCNII